MAHKAVPFDLNTFRYELFNLKTAVETENSARVIDSKHIVELERVTQKELLRSHGNRPKTRANTRVFCFHMA